MRLRHARKQYAIYVQLYEDASPYCAWYSSCGVHARCGVMPGHAAYCAAAAWMARVACSWRSASST